MIETKNRHFFLSRSNFQSVQTIFITSEGYLYHYNNFTKQCLDKPTTIPRYKFNNKIRKELSHWFFTCVVLAHLSIPMVRRPSVVHTFKLEASWPVLIKYYILHHWSGGKAALGFGAYWINSGFHGNKKPRLTYNGENNVSTFSRLFFIRSFLYLQVMRTCIKSRTSSNFGQLGPLTTELAILSV